MRLDVYKLPVEARNDRIQGEWGMMVRVLSPDRPPMVLSLMRSGEGEGDARDHEKEP